MTDRRSSNGAQLSAEEVTKWLEENPSWLKSYLTEKFEKTPVGLATWLSDSTASCEHKTCNGWRSNGSSVNNNHSATPSPRETSPHETSPISPHNDRNTQRESIRKFFPSAENRFPALSPTRNGDITSNDPGSTNSGLTSVSVPSPSEHFVESRTGNQRSNSKKYLRHTFARSRIRALLKANEPSVSFERETLADRRSSLKGMRQFLSLPPTPAGPTLSMLIQSKVRLPARYASKNEDLKRLLRLQNFRDFFLEVVRDISNDLDMSSLTGSILVNTALLLLAETSCLFLVEGPRSRPKFICKTFCAEQGREAMTSLSGHVTAEDVKWGQGLIGHVAETKSVVNLRNPTQDPRYKEDLNILGRLTGIVPEYSPGVRRRILEGDENEDLSLPEGRLGPRRCSIYGAGISIPGIPRVANCLLCMPICNAEGEVVAVVQLINKTQSAECNEFNEDDEKKLETYLAFCGMAISNAQAIEAYTREYDRNKALLEVVHDLFEEQTSVPGVVTKIMQRAQTLLNCERCVVLLEDTASDNSKGSEHCQLFDLKQSKIGQPVQPLSPTMLQFDVRNNDQQLLSPAPSDMVNLTDERLENIYSVAHDIVSSNSNSVLCKPIRDSLCRTIGAAQLINKLEGGQFDENDERLFEAFTIFCGLGINNCQMYDQTARAAAKQAVALEVLSYHATISTDLVQRFKNILVPSITHWRLDNAEFNDFTLNSDEMALAAIRIFQDMGLVRTFKIDYETLIRWLLTVRKNYRNVAYHNWRHAFNVFHFMYIVLERCNIRKHVSDLECLALMVACICHDLDHRGTNNAFQQKSSSALSQLYGTQATLEHHHFNHAVMILNSEGHNIFRNLNSLDYSRLMNFLKHAILATDLSLHMQVRSRFFSMVKSSDQDLDWTACSSMEILRSILMTTCDISSIAKPWEVQLKSADLVIMEFFEQGDKEKKMLNLQPLAIMDREKRDELPRLQIEWIDGICLPLYKALTEMDSSFQPMLNNVISNRENWQELQSRLNNQGKQTAV